MKEELFSILNLKNREDIKKFAKKINVNVSTLTYFNDNCIYPEPEIIKKVLKGSPNLTEFELKIRLGHIDSTVLEYLQKNAKEIASTFKLDSNTKKTKRELPKAEFSTPLGKLFKADCLDIMKNMEDNSVDLIFADPPFNLNKEYESGINDKLSKTEYLNWTEKWITECIRILKEGGSFFIWNLPSWNTYSAEILNKHLSLRHWIAVDIKYSLPIANKLYPSHYSLLYYVKGDKPATFNQERLPLEICRHCSGDIKDYGGYKKKLNIQGISLTDVWRDISPVRHKKYKNRGSNELPLNLLERIISLSTNEGDLVFDPFGGSGTTFVVSEILKRRWTGTEIGPIDIIQERFDDLVFPTFLINDIQNSKNKLFTKEMRKLRIKNGHWLPESLS
ncbi:site-specific DNA-methyltransferase [Bacillus thuringiensis]|uniref:site-specific DNA-methyltransferase n=1 Tax=Bacillus thuringiensis TaxID=1428 RepID=UPI00273CB645|nr:site-specific DNA-methyltransferase [Bacillus thuringiensis]WLP64236.1 site-specific DNA-methyltransferase [Bacillus thuringiensis]